MFFLNFILIYEVNSQPLLISNSNLLDENLRLFLGNCSRMTRSPDFGVPIVILNPRTAWKEGSELLDMVYVKSFIYAISNQGILYGLDGRTGEEIASLNLFPGETTSLAMSPVHTLIKRSHLTVGVISESDDRARVLLAMSMSIVNNEGEEKSLGIVFDITDPYQLNRISELSPKKMTKVIAKPFFVRMSSASDHHWGIIWAGAAKELGALQFIPLAAPSAVIEYTTRGRDISIVEAVDLDSRGVVDRIYAGDLTGALWVFDLKQSDHPKAKKIASLQVLSGPKVVKANHGGGVYLYVLAENESREQRMYALEDKLNTTDELIPVLLDKTATLDYFIRFGRAIFVPRSNSLPFVMNLASHKPVAVAWESMKSTTELGAESGSEKICEGDKVVKLLWDPKKHQDILVTLNSKCQLNSMTGTMNADRLGRQSFKNY